MPPAIIRNAHTAVLPALLCVFGCLACDVTELMQDGEFKESGPHVNGAHSAGDRATVALSVPCPCASMRGVQLTPSANGVAKVAYGTALAAPDEPGWYQASWFALVDAGYDGGDLIGTASLHDVAGEVVDTKDVPRGGGTGAWLQFDAVLADPYKTARHMRLSFGGAFTAGALTVTQISLVRSGAEDMPNIAQGLGATGPKGYSGLAGLTDMETESSSGSTWTYAVHADTPIPVELELDFQDTNVVCGVSLVWVA